MAEVLNSGPAKATFGSTMDDGSRLRAREARLLNAGLCHSPAGGAWLLPTAEEVIDRKVPIAIGVVGEALGAVGQLAELNWI